MRISSNCRRNRTVRAPAGMLYLKNVIKRKMQEENAGAAPGRRTAWNHGRRSFPMKTEKQLARAYSELAQRLTGKRFLTASGLTRKEAAALLNREAWLEKLGRVLPIRSTSR